MRRLNPLFNEVQKGVGVQEKFLGLGGRGDRCAGVIDLVALAAAGVKVVRQLLDGLAYSELSPLEGESVMPGTLATRCPAQAIAILAV